MRGLSTLFLLSSRTRDYFAFFAYTPSRSGAITTSLVAFSFSSFFFLQNHHQLCWVLDRDTYRGMLLNITFKKRERYMAFLDKISILSALTPYNKARIADMLEPCEAEPGESICQEGTDGDTFFMIEDGRFSIRTKAEGEVGQLGQGEYFGELALLYSQPRKATVVSLTKSHLVRLRRKEFDSYLGSLEQLRSEADRYRGEATLLHPVGGAETNSDIGCLLDNFEVCSSSSGRMHTPMRGP